MDINEAKKIVWEKYPKARFQKAHPNDDGFIYYKNCKRRNVLLSDKYIPETKAWISAAERIQKEQTKEQSNG